MLASQQEPALSPEEEARLEAMKAYAPKPHPEGELKSICLFPSNGPHIAKIGANLSPKLEANLMNLLQRNANYFAWSPADMGGIPWEIMEHCLAVKLGHVPK